MRKNVELLLRNLEQPHPKRNRDEIEEEERNNHVNGRGYREENRGENEEDNFWPSPHGGRREDVGDLSRIITKLDRRCMHMEMERKGKGKSLVVDKLLSSTDSSFIDRVVNFRLPKKFKVPQIMSYAGDGDPFHHLKNFRAHIDILKTPDEVACQAFPLTLTGNARGWFRKLPPQLGRQL
jgi:hypothetical protein